MSRNKNLYKAKKQKNDEFYTQLSDIEKELVNYKEHFYGKTVFCNCDDPEHSNFFKYFIENFNALGLKQLIVLGYKAFPVMELFKDEAGISKNPLFVVCICKVAGECDLDINHLLKIKGNTRYELHGDNNYPAGDFRSKESIAFLKQSDVVVTNPPFSLFREYMAQLMEYKKKFLIVGNKNAVTYKEFFPLIKEDKVWFGYCSIKTFLEQGVSVRKFGNVG